MTPGGVSDLRYLARLARFVVTGKLPEFTSRTGGFAMMATMRLMTLGDVVRVLTLPGAVAFVFLCGWVVRLMGRVEARREHAIDTSGYQVPKHFCMIDFNRSVIARCDDGSIIACCCFQRCGHQVRISRDTVEAYIETAPQLGAGDR